MGWSESDIPDQSGRTYVITGGNSGLGWETARALASRGAEVILACRSAPRAEEAVASIKKRREGASVRAMSLDLASLTSIRAFVEAFDAAHPKLHGLVNNAGLMAIPHNRTADGFEMQLGTNHLGHFALTALLFPKLAATSGARIVTVSSTAHRMGSMRWDDLMWERGYDRWRVYGQSKLANLLFHNELASRLRQKNFGVLATAAHPGYAATNLQTKGMEMGGSRLEGLFMRVGNGIAAQSAAAGALPTLRAAVDPSAESGDYYGPSGFMELTGAPKKVGMTSAACDMEAARKLWQHSETLTKTSFAGL